MKSPDNIVASQNDWILVRTRKAQLSPVTTYHDLSRRTRSSDRKYEWLPNSREQPRIGFRKAERIMKAAELVKKYGIVEGERRMISDTKGIIWRENREGTLIPVLIYIPGKDED